MNTGRFVIKNGSSHEFAYVHLTVKSAADKK